MNRYCYECVNKATNERKCIVCGGHRPQPVGKMIYCELCPRAYHHDCYIPPMIKVPRGKWYCHGCASKAPPPKRRGPKKPKEPKEAKEQKESKESKNNSSNQNVTAITASATVAAIPSTPTTNSNQPNMTSTPLSSKANEVPPAR